ncbi:hypothetical protein MMC25_006548 [Agyrium rufum]|nr:hypothetical protein [Agyrium rufum]
MCGIYVNCSYRSDDSPNQLVRELLHGRGPDYTNTTRTEVALSWAQLLQPISKGIYLDFRCSVLHLRDEHITSQPFTTEPHDSLLCWNGEAWKIRGEDVTGSDTQAVFTHLDVALKQVPSDHEVREETLANAFYAFIHALEDIEGPYALVFYDAKHKCIFYGRDKIGRRSLLLREEDSLTLSSVQDGRGNWSEVRANGQYQIDLEWIPPDAPVSHYESKILAPTRRINHMVWPSSTLSSSKLFPFTREIPPVHEPPLQMDDNVIQDLESRLRASVSRRIRNIPLLFTDDGANAPVEKPRVAILFSGGIDCTLLARLVHDELPQDYEVDLLNVAFENPRSIAAAKANQSGPSDDSKNSCYNRCPDRLTGLSTFNELISECPNRPWRFVSIDVPYSQLTDQKARILELMYPHNTEMDFSIACALYFAAKGTGLATKHPSGQVPEYKTPARVLLSGLGADELFAGYTRHSTVFHRGGCHALFDELELDINRLADRNLSRDDRILSHCGREPRYPYLDEGLVEWAMQLPIWKKCGFAQLQSGEKQLKGVPIDDPAKLILRMLVWKLGLKKAAIEKKRAIQFGAKTAKMVGGKTKGTQIISN